jgi:hypothetical protein
LVRGEPASVLYKEYVKANADLAAELAVLVGNIVDYGRTRQQLDRLAKSSIFHPLLLNEAVNSSAKLVSKTQGTRRWPIFEGTLDKNHQDLAKNRPGCGFGRKLTGPRFCHLGPPIASCQMNEMAG